MKSCSTCVYFRDAHCMHTVNRRMFGRTIGHGSMSMPAEIYDWKNTFCERHNANVHTELEGRMCVAKQKIGDQEVETEAYVHGVVDGVLLLVEFVDTGKIEIVPARSVRMVDPIGGGKA